MNLAPCAVQQFFDNNGRPLVGGLLFTYEAGTSTKAETYLDEAGTPNTNPIELDFRGECRLWLDPEKAYKFVLSPRGDTDPPTRPIWTADNIVAPVTAGDIPPYVEAVVTQEFIGQRLWPRTEQEIENGVDPVNYAYPYLDVRRYGAVGDGVTNCTLALKTAVIASRQYPEDRLDTIGGDIITMYRSGVITFPKGIFKLDPDVLEFTQEMGITLQGQGSRRFTNAIRAATTLLFSGPSSGFGIKLYRNGARSMNLVDIDVCYEDSSFTGHLIDMIDAPGLKLRRCFLGCFGISGATRVQSAASLMRMTYLEDVCLEDCSLDGGVDGIWIDDTRTELGNTFGGWGLVLERCTFYDFTGKMVRHDGNRTFTNLSIRDSHFNPINVDCDRCLDITNVDGISVDGCIFTPSTSAKATSEWVRILEATGSIRNNVFNDLSKAGTFSGQLEISCNTIFCTDGITLKSGVISGSNNEFSQGSNGWTLSPDNSLCFTLGPDWFKSGISGRSYNIPADSSNLSGRVHYSAERDGSGSKFLNASNRVTILAVDGKYYTVGDSSYDISILDTGRTAVATGAAGAQTFTLPAPVPGCELSVMKASAEALTVTAGSNIIYTGFGSLKTSVSAANASDIGGTVSFRALGSSAWVLVSRVGDWVVA